MRGAERVQVRILDQVVGLGPIRGEPPRERLQRAQMVERLGVERRLAVSARSCHGTIVNTGWHPFIQPLLLRGATPLGLPHTLSRAPLRRRAPFAWLARALARDRGQLVLERWLVFNLPDRRLAPSPLNSRLAPSPLNK